MDSDRPSGRFQPHALAALNMRIQALEREREDLKARLSAALADAQRERAVRLRYAAEIRKFSAHGIEGDIED